MAHQLAEPEVLPGSSVAACGRLMTGRFQVCEGDHQSEQPQHAKERCRCGRTRIARRRAFVPRPAGLRPQLGPTIRLRSVTGTHPLTFGLGLTQRSQLRRYRYRRSRGPCMDVCPFPRRHRTCADGAWSHTLARVGCLRRAADSFAAVGHAGAHPLPSPCEVGCGGSSETGR